MTIKVALKKEKKKGKKVSPNSKPQAVSSVIFNPFIAMLAMPSLRKQQIKVPNLKPLSFFPPFA